MTLKEVASALKAGPRGKALASAVKSKTDTIEVYNLAGSSVAVMLATLPQLKVPTVVIADSLDDAGYIYHDLTRLLGEEAVAMLPSGYKRHIKYGQPDPPSQILRTEALTRWSNDKDLRFVVTYPEALAERVAERDTIDRHTSRSVPAPRPTSPKR